MPRARRIKYGFFINEKLAELEPLCRILFEGLWLLADRDGKLEDRPKKIHAQILPYDNDADIDAYLCALENAQFLHRYKIGDAQFIKILNFNDHQNPHKDEAASKIPDPVTQKHQSCTEVAPKCDDVKSLVPCTLYPGNIKKEKSKKKKKDVDLRFEQFYNQYPRHKDRERASAVFKKLNPSDELFDEIMISVKNQKAEYKLKNDDATYKYFKYAAPWLNNKCWTDEVDLSIIEKDKEKKSPYTVCRECGKEFLKVDMIDEHCQPCDWKLHPM